MDSTTGETNLNPMVEEEELFSYAMALVNGSVPIIVLRAIIELDVLEIIKRAGPKAYLSPEEIAAELPTNNPDAAVMLDRILRLLASYSIVTCSIQMLPDGSAKRLYGLAPICKFLTKNEDGVSLAALSLMTQDMVELKCWHYLKEAVLEGGISFKKAHGTTLFEYNEVNPRFSKVFNNAMSDPSILVTKRILEAYKGFEGLSSLVDVGGGIGTTLNMIISKYPMIKGINFDLPHVIRDSPSFPGRREMAPITSLYRAEFCHRQGISKEEKVFPSISVQHVGGDMFISVPKGDAIIMKRVFHNWNDEQCIKLLKNCYASLPDHGKVIACESILPTAVEATAATKVVFTLDLVMMAQTTKGKERSKNEFEDLAKGAGFQGFRVVSSAYHIKVMEFLKKN